MANELEVPFSLIVEEAPANVAFAVQLGAKDLLAPTRHGKELRFEFRLRLKRGPAGQLIFLGAAAQGPPQDRFVYVNSGARAGQANSPWSRRAKIKLASIDPPMVDRVLRTTGARLEARIPAIGRDGGPSCATTKPIGGSWRLVR